MAPRAIAVSGCGLNGFYCLGACRYLQLQKIPFLYYAGSSAGSIIVSCMATRVDLRNAVRAGQEFFAYADLGGMAQSAIANIVSKYGVIDPDEFFRNIFDRMGLPDITFSEQHATYGTHLFINAYCINTREEVVYSHATSPHKRIREAIMESCTVPLVFGLSGASQRICVDGVMCGAFTPSHVLRDRCSPGEIVRVHMSPSPPRKSSDVLGGLADYIGRVISAAISTVRQHDEECDKSCLRIPECVDSTVLFSGIFDRGMASVVPRMVGHGFKTAREWWNSSESKNVLPSGMSCVMNNNVMGSKGFMQVVKRNGLRENVSFDKILRRIHNLAEDPSLTLLVNIDSCKIAQQVISSLHDGIKTTELDTLAAETAISYSTVHPDYGALAARIEVSNLHKSTNASFGEVLKSVEVNDHVRDMYERHAMIIEGAIDYSRDFLFDYFAIKTLSRSYLASADSHVVERPQHMWMRVALAIHDDIEAALETYESMSKLLFTHATPTLFNAGTNRQQMSSCFLMTVEDSISNIYKVLSDCAHISKWCGGVGMNVSNIRGKDSHIKGTNGVSSGIVPMARVFNDTARYVNQGGKRLGSFALYLEPWHVDIFDFLDLKKNVGHEHERARDLFYALWIPDLFMKRVKEQGVWSLFSPDEAPGLTECHGEEFERLYAKYESERKYRKQLPAMDVWVRILESQIETGTPYMMYKDACNLKSNQSNLGTIQCSNLCVAPETVILTPDGYRRIADLEDRVVEVWNGVEWSLVTVRRTSDRAELVEVELTNGTRVECTKEHRFWTNNDPDPEEESVYYETPAAKLRVGEFVMPLDLPKEPIAGDEEYPHAYTAGVHYVAKSHDEIVMDEAFFLKVMDKIHVRTAARVHDGKFLVKLPFDMPPKLGVPNGRVRIQDKLAWFAGICDAVGTSTTACPLLIRGLGVDEARAVQLFLQEIGVRSAVTAQQLEVYGVNSLDRLGIKSYLRRLRFGDEPPVEPVRVSSVTHTGRWDKTYCFTEPLRHRGTFNGMLTGNCSEIVQYTSVEKGEVAVCNLASICLSKFVTGDRFDFEQLRKTVRILVRNIDKIIEKNYYPIPETRESNLRHRPMGIGVQGLADAFAMLGYAWESEEARKLNREIFEHMYFAALDESCELAGKLGAYPTFAGSPASQGRLQYHLWGVQPSTNLDWAGLVERVKATGLRNSLLIALMPTASTGQIMGNNECIEPFTNNLYLRRVLSGEFVVVNKHLVRYLVDRGLWSEGLKDQILRNRGSVQSLDLPPDVKAVYKTVWEIPQRVLIDMARDRGAFVCQHQSLNLFVPNGKLNFNVLSAMHMYNWASGNKGSYYLRTQSAAMAVPVTLDPRGSEPHAPEPSAACESCSS